MNDRPSFPNNLDAYWVPFSSNRAPLFRAPNPDKIVFWRKVAGIRIVSNRTKSA
jgi:hypothetical protein